MKALTEIEMDTVIGGDNMDPEQLGSELQQAYINMLTEYIREHNYL